MTRHGAVRSKLVRKSQRAFAIAGGAAVVPKPPPVASPARRRASLSIHVALNHVTHYRYDRRVALSPHMVRLRPAPHSRTRILSYSLSIEPARHFINWQQDPESNYLARVVFPDRTEQLRIEVDLIAEMAVLNPFDFFLEPHAENFPFNYEAGEASELAPVSGPTSGDSAAGELPRVDSPQESRHHRFSRRPEHAPVAGHPLPDPHGTGRADAGNNARQRLRILPRFELAVGAAPAKPGTGQPLRVGLPHPAHARCEIARRTFGADR